MPNKIALKLDFVKPFEAHNIVMFTLEPEGGSTNVTWAMEGPVPYFAKIIHLVRVRCDDRKTRCRKPMPPFDY